MMLRPSLHYKAVQDIDLELLQKKGIRGLLLDADNTLSPWRAQSISEDIIKWVQRAKEMDFSLVIVSNASAQRLQPLSNLLQIPAYPRCSKPLPFGVLRAAKALNIEPSACALVGDQLLTDIPAGALNSMLTILVDPIDPSREFTGTKINRKIEKLLLKRR